MFSALKKYALACVVLVAISSMRVYADSPADRITVLADAGNRAMAHFTSISNQDPRLIILLAAASAVTASGLWIFIKTFANPSKEKSSSVAAQFVALCKSAGSLVTGSLLTLSGLALILSSKDLITLVEIELYNLRCTFNSKK